METIHDDFIVGLVKGKIGEVMDRMDRERPELSHQDRETVTVRLSTPIRNYSDVFRDGIFRCGAAL